MISKRSTQRHISLCSACQGEATLAAPSLRLSSKCISCPFSHLWRECLNTHWPEALLPAAGRPGASVEVVQYCIIGKIWHRRIEDACRHGDKPARMSSLKCRAHDTAAKKKWYDAWKKLFSAPFLNCNVFLRYCIFSTDGFTHLGLLHLDL